MSTETRREEAPTQPPQLVEMSWDPMTRIVGSLGIYTKIDFKNRRVAEAFSATLTSSRAASVASAVTTTQPARSILRIWPMG